MEQGARCLQHVRGSCAKLPMRTPCHMKVLCHDCMPTPASSWSWSWSWDRDSDVNQGKPQSGRASMVNERSTIVLLAIALPLAFTSKPGFSPVLGKNTMADDVSRAGDWTGKQDRSSWGRGSLHLRHCLPFSLQGRRRSRHHFKSQPGWNSHEVHTALTR